MNNLGENCKCCKCSKCKHIAICGTMAGNTVEYCEQDCLGVNSQMTNCSEFERSE